MRLIFVAGCPRSGSTWFSTALARGTRSTLINEPFNPPQYPDREEFTLKYLPAGAQDPTFCRIVKSSIREVRGPRWWAEALLRRERYVLKEVHAIFAAEYLWERFNTTIIILMRHPCAMADSWSRLGWTTHWPRYVNAMLAQESLLTTHLATFRDRLRRPDDDFARLGMYWGAVYRVLLDQAARHPDWLVVRHEDLCLDPVAQVGAVIEKIGLRLHPRGRSFLIENNREQTVRDDPYSLDRDSSKERNKWMHSLQPEQAQSVLRGAEPFGIYQKYYRELTAANTGLGALLPATAAAVPVPCPGPATKSSTSPLH